MSTTRAACEDASKVRAAGEARLLGLNSTLGNAPPSAALAAGAGRVPGHPTQSERDTGTGDNHQVS